MKYLICLFLILYSVLLALQGMDFGDAGWHLTAYEQIFNNPSNVNYYFMYWLSGVLGHLWQSILPRGGLFWSRIGVVVFLMFTFILYARLLQTFQVKQNPLLLLLPVYLFVYGGGPEALNYDVLTQFFYAVSLIFLLKGIIQNKTSLLFIAGLFLGFNIFIKISNLTGLLFLGIIPWYSFVHKTKNKEGLKQSMAVVTGLLLSIASSLVTMKALGQLDIYLSNLGFLIRMSGSSEASHNFLNLLSAYGSGYLKTGLISLPVLALFLYLPRIITLPKISRANFNLALVLTGFVVAFVAFRAGNPFWSKVRYFFLGSMFFTGFYLVWNKENKPTMRLLAFSGLILLFIAPLGSDSGIEKMNWGAWILGPLFLDKASRKETFSFLKQKFSWGSQKLYRGLMIILLITFFSYAWNNPYNDPGSRFKKTFPVNIPGLKHIHTTRERAACVTGLIKGIRKFVQPGDTLLAFIEIPMVHYLTGTTPYLSTSWPKLYYSAELFRNALFTPSVSANLPVVIRQTVNIAHSNWPIDTIPHYTGYREPSVRYKEYGLILNKFLKQDNYSLIWHNRAFELWIPPNGSGRIEE